MTVGRSGCCVWGGLGRNETGGGTELRSELSLLQGDSEKQQVQPISDSHRPPIPAPQPGRQCTRRLGSGRRGEDPAGSMGAGALRVGA
uniref:Uncharacterized protein n=1 Tax=Rangifer tarandus platyrhynchus TaxID=3082113 RepID=A0ACB0FJ91_RANTA|nr:unnamed protein product [Rangifer tarandus platyrhynchus]